MIIQSALDPSTITTVPSSYRAAAAFLSSMIVGGAVHYRYGNRLRAAVEASTENLPLALLYGFFAYALAGFLVAYGLIQLSRLGISASMVLLITGIVLGGFLLTLGGFGYVVVGAWLVDRTGLGDLWLGLLGVSLVGAFAILVLPFILGIVAWFAIAAVGLGGTVRRWVHADAASRRANHT